MEHILNNIINEQLYYKTYTELKKCHQKSWYIPDIELLSSRQMTSVDTTCNWYCISTRASL